MNSYNAQTPQNAPIPQKQKPKFSTAITTPLYQKLIRNTLGDQKRAQKYIAAISSAVAVNKQLQECDAGTILSGSLLGEALNLPHSPNLGYYYLVPFYSKGKTDYKTGEVLEAPGMKATFVLGYKGYLQLAMRSGFYRKINVVAIKEGELKSFDPLNEEISAIMIDDYDKRETAPTIGYYAMFEYNNGFRKAIYWSKKKMIAHADKYSPAFSKDATTGKNPKVSYEDFLAGNYPPADEWKYSSFWYSDFDGMAEKTMIRQLISKWGIMSTEFQMAYENDNAVIHMDEDGNFIGSFEDGEEINPKQSQLPGAIRGDQIMPESVNTVEKVDLSTL